MKKKPRVKCRSCDRLSKQLAERDRELFAATVERNGYDQARGGEVEFYRGLMKDLVDDYLIRRSPFTDVKPEVKP